MAEALARMSRDLLAQDTAQHTLKRIAEHARDLVPGCEHAGILLVHHNQRVETPRPPVTSSSSPTGCRVD